MVALAVAAGSATLVAVTVTACWAATVVGAWYVPLTIRPTWCGPKDHVTVVSEVPLTLAVKVALCPRLSEVLAGDTPTLTFLAGKDRRRIGFTTRETAALLVGSATLAAVNVTVCGETMSVGAV